MPRLQFRKKTPAETFQPIFKHLDSAIEFVASQVSKPEGRKILEQSNHLACLIAENISWDKGESPTISVSPLYLLCSLLLKIVQGNIIKLYHFDSGRPFLSD